MNTKIQHMENLIEELNNATKAYDAGKPYLSDHAWDDKYFELLQLEKEIGYALSNSPTQQVNYQIVSALQKVEHSHPMLSLEKTKNTDEIKAFIGNNDFIAMCKMDGLTCSLTYENGKLIVAETRGNGVVGEDILHNALVIPSIPNRIAHKERLVIDGEIICRLDIFTNNFAGEYKNARNFAAGSIRLLDASECAKRQLTFVAWDVIEGLEDTQLLSDKLVKLANLGFISVPFILSTSESEIDYDAITFSIQQYAQECAYPIDGVVFKFNNVAYGRSLGSTAHHFKNAMAYKFYDETYPTELNDIEWTMGRTGQLTPIALVQPVDIDGSTISRASLHNIDIMQEFLHGNGWRGQKLEIYRANMIIPQVYSAEPDDDSTKEYFTIPSTCPVCGGRTVVRKDVNTSNLYCDNPDCEGKLINKLDHFCGKKGLEIKGLSKATLEKLIEWGWVTTLADIYKLAEHKDEWAKKPGFGEKSVANILNAIAASTNPTLQSFISSIGIPLIGNTMSKELIKHVNSYEEFRQLVNERFDFSQFEGFASSKTSAILDFNYAQADEVYEIVKPLKLGVVDKSEQKLTGCTVAITGRLTQFKNRAIFQAAIEALGGKVVSSVSSNTDFLINNDNTSNSAKNLTAKKLGIPILTEDEFIYRFL